MMTDTRCALWYWCYGNLRVELHDADEEAAEDAVSMEDNGEGSVSGIQYPDGSFVTGDAWPAYQAEQSRRNAEAKALMAEWAKQPPPATRKVKPPFDDAQSIRATVPADYPDWVGRQEATP